MEKKKSIGLELLKLLGIAVVGWFLWLLIFSAFTPEEVEDVVEPFTGASMVLGLFTGLMLYLGLEVNRLSMLKQRVKQTKSNITIAVNRSDSLLEKANKVADKYMNFEKGAVQTIAHAIKPSAGASTVIKNSGNFEQRLNEFPELKSNQAVMELLGQLRESENAIANFKLEHNDFVARYNFQVATFPLVVFKFLVKDKEYEYYTDNNDIVSDDALGI